MHPFRSVAPLAPVAPRGFGTHGRMRWRAATRKPFRAPVSPPAGVITAMPPPALRSIRTSRFSWQNWKNCSRVMSMAGAMCSSKAAGPGRCWRTTMTSGYRTRRAGINGETARGRAPHGGPQEPVGRVPRCIRAAMHSARARQASPPAPTAEPCLPGVCAVTGAHARLRCSSVAHRHATLDAVPVNGPRRRPRRQASRRPWRGPAGDRPGRSSARRPRGPRRAGT